MEADIYRQGPILAQCQQLLEVEALSLKPEHRELDDPKNPKTPALRV